MGEYYIFTIFVFVLCLILIFALRMLLLKGDRNDTAKEEKLMKLYSQVEEMMESFEEYADDVKLELADEKKKMLRDIRIEADELKRKNTAYTRRNEPESSAAAASGITNTRTVKIAADMYKTAAAETDNAEKRRMYREDSAEENISFLKDSTEDISEQTVSEETFTEVVSNEDLSTKTQIMSMYKSGVPAAQIAKKMNMNISEINLIIMLGNKK